jgi:hypothetical protein
MLEKQSLSLGELDFTGKEKTAMLGEVEVGVMQKERLR